MITVMFESKGYCQVVAQFVEESTYMACLPVLEQLAKEACMTITESVSD